MYDLNNKVANAHNYIAHSTMWCAVSFVHSFMRSHLPAEDKCLWNTERKSRQSTTRKFGVCREGAYWPAYLQNIGCTCVSAIATCTYVSAIATFTCVSAIASCTCVSAISPAACSSAATIHIVDSTCWHAWGSQEEDPRRLFKRHRTSASKIMSCVHADISGLPVKPLPESIRARSEVLLPPLHRPPGNLPPYEACNEGHPIVRW